MSNQKLIFLLFSGCFLLLCLGVHECKGQELFQKLLLDKNTFAESELTALDQGETVVKLLPAQNKREIAMSGMVRLQVPAQMFLDSFRDNMTSKNNPAILEIGSFKDSPSLEDFQGLTIEERDIDDLRQCVRGDCQVKLSALMIERLQREVDWNAPDYRTQVTQLLKQMLVDYVHDYLARGNAALIAYDDKPGTVLAASSYDPLAGTKQVGKNSSTSELALVQNALVWSKIKFGLKPVIAINHIMIYKRAAQVGAEILVVSKQIYASHYFDASLALTAFLNVSAPTPKSYLFYENRSRVDGLEGPFGKIKRGFIVQKAMGNLEGILVHSQKTLNAMNGSDSSPEQVEIENAPRRWKLGRVLPLLLLALSIAALSVWALRAYGWTGAVSRSAHS
jgi:hypothetical protein